MSVLGVAIGVLSLRRKQQGYNSHEEVPSRSALERDFRNAEDSLLCFKDRELEWEGTPDWVPQWQLDRRAIAQQNGHDQVRVPAHASPASAAAALVEVSETDGVVTPATPRRVRRAVEAAARLAVALASHIERERWLRGYSVIVAAAACLEFSSQALALEQSLLSTRVLRAFEIKLGAVHSARNVLWLHRRELAELVREHGGAVELLRGPERGDGRFPWYVWRRDRGEEEDWAERLGEREEGRKGSPLREVLLAGEEGGALRLRLRKERSGRGVEGGVRDGENMCKRY